MAKKTEVQLLEEEVRKGNGEAYYNLGYIYLLGQGVKIDEKKAVEYFRKGTTHKSTKCMQGLAMCYKHGDGVEIDLEKTIYWLNQGVKLNDDDCMYQLALCYEKGIGVVQDMIEATRLMELSSKKNKDAKIWLKGHSNKKSIFDRLFGGK